MPTLREKLIRFGVEWGDECIEYLARREDVRIKEVRDAERVDPYYRLTLPTGRSIDWCSGDGWVSSEKAMNAMSDWVERLER